MMWASFNSIQRRRAALQLREWLLAAVVVVKCRCCCCCLSVAAVIVKLSPLRLQLNRRFPLRSRRYQGRGNR